MAASGQKLSRDDWRKQKELEEARKAGTAPAEVDEEGRWVLSSTVQCSWSFFNMLVFFIFQRHQSSYPAIHFSSSLVRHSRTVSRFIIRLVTLDWHLH